MMTCCVSINISSTASFLGMGRRRRWHHLMDIFWDNLGKPVPDCLHSGFTEAKDDGGDDDNCSYMTW